ncbi:hypothetical protein BC939DRAFT_329057 [Gamsiella multidivaricata]|uniref:uncharacterized protein n=1 Tax=Gamsiella multidivaricata TaxID=101098 RepID=UPI00221E6AFD|nr:uncharacterized protein BC939DRAFT_329057 [Gamsiella multidivaricata]KAI7817501.1 hypothetical protein BC939DRAFT_329057 [Gamsiella multidivaricata]
MPSPSPVPACFSTQLIIGQWSECSATLFFSPLAFPLLQMQCSLIIILSIVIQHIYNLLGIQPASTKRKHSALLSRQPQPSKEQTANGRHFTWPAQKFPSWPSLPLFIRLLLLPFAASFSSFSLQHFFIVPIPLISRK